MNMLKDMFRIFCYVTTGITINAAIYLTFIDRGNYRFSYEFLWQFIIMAAISSIGTLIFMSRKELSKKQLLGRMILHYVYINLIVMGGAYFFEWLEQGEIFGTVILFIMVAVVYFIIMFVMFKNDERIARDMNRKLRNPDIKEEED